MLVLLLIPTGKRLLYLYSIKQLGIDLDSKVYVINGWLDINNQTVNLQEFKKPELASNRFLASSQTISRDGKMQAVVTADKKVLSFFNVLPDPTLIIYDTNGQIINNFPLYYYDEDKNVPNYIISFSPNGGKIALLTSEQIEVVDTLSSNSTKVDITTLINAACIKHKRPIKSCEEFSYYSYQKGLLDWTDDSKLIFNVYGSLYMLDVLTSKIEDLNVLDTVQKFQTLDEKTIAYINVPNGEIESSELRIYDIQRKTVLKTFPKIRKYGIDALATSPDGKSILLGDTGCGSLDVDCGGSYLISITALNLESGKSSKLIHKHQYKQNSHLNIYWINN